MNLQLANTKNAENSARKNWLKIVFNNLLPVDIRLRVLFTTHDISIYCVFQTLDQTSCDYVLHLTNKRLSINLRLCDHQDGQTCVALN